MKLLVLLLVLLVAAAWVFGRGKRRQVKPPTATATPPKPEAAAKAGEMLACTHCGVHSPAAEAAFDVAGRPYCSAEHRVAGPR